MTPPLRFLIAVTGGWACGRGAILLWSGGADGPGGLSERKAVFAYPAAGSAPVRTVRRVRAVRPAPSPAAESRLSHWAAAAGATRLSAPAPPRIQRGGEVAAGYHRRARAGPPRALALGTAGSAPAPLAREPAPEPRPAPGAAGGVQAPAPARIKSGGRWSLAGFVHARRGGGPDLAPGGSLGGSQAAAKLAYRLAGSPSAPVSLVARIAAPLQGRGAEAAFGVEWQPHPGLPLRIAAERRQALARNGRSALALGVHGGATAAVAGFRIDAYGQAGLVGLRRRDPYAEGQLRASRPLRPGGGLRLGAAVWAAAQPGVSRLDLGPSASLGIAGARATVTIDWRHRAAGNARPGSGPALTVWTDF